MQKPKEVTEAIEHIQGALRRNDPNGPHFAMYCRTVRQWAKAGITDGCDGTDRSARNILAGIVGGDVLPYVAP